MRGAEGMSDSVRDGIRGDVRGGVIDSKASVSATGLSLREDQWNDGSCVFQMRLENLPAAIC